VPEPLAVMLGSLRLGGGERVGLLLAEAFAARGHRVDLVVAECEGQYLDQVPKAVRLIPLAASSQLTGRRLEFAADPGGWPILVPLQLGMHPHRLSKRLPALVHYLQTERPYALGSVGTPANMAALRAARVSGRQSPVLPAPLPVGLSHRRPPSVSACPCHHCSLRRSRGRSRRDGGHPARADPDHLRPGFPRC